MRTLRLVPILVALFFASAASAKPAKTTQPPIDRQAFHDGMRKLWEEHVVWTRLYIVSATGDLGDKDQAAKRLMQNQTDIGNAIKPFYGNDAGDELTALLKEHIQISTQIVDAAMKGDDQAKADAVKRWQTNADDIATFLNQANAKSWPLDAMKKMMREHLDKTTAELTDHLKKDWDDDVADFDAVENQILGMADMLSDGIMKQFPKKFRAR
jgi:hypothetical protein